MSTPDLEAITYATAVLTLRVGWHPAIPCTGVGRYSGTRNAQNGFAANAVQADLDLETGRVTMKWYGTKHGTTTSSWFGSGDPVLDDIRRDVARRVRAAGTVEADRRRHDERKGNR